MTTAIRTLKLALRSALADADTTAVEIYEAFFDVVRDEKIAAETLATKSREALKLLEGDPFKVPEYLSNPSSRLDSSFKFSDSVIYGGEGSDTISFG